MVARLPDSCSGALIRTVSAQMLHTATYQTTYDLTSSTVIMEREGNSCSRSVDKSVNGAIKIKVKRSLQASLSLLALSADALYGEELFGALGYKPFNLPQLKETNSLIEECKFSTEASIRIQQGRATFSPYGTRAQAKGEIITTLNTHCNCFLTHCGILFVTVLGFHLDRLSPVPLKPQV